MVLKVQMYFSVFNKPKIKVIKIKYENIVMVFWMKIPTLII